MSHILFSFKITKKKCLLVTDCKIKINNLFHIIGSAAAAWQSSIGSVAAGSLFAVLQSLGATGLGILLFGSVGAGLGLLSSSAAAIGWCTCEQDKNAQEPTNDPIEKTESSTKSEQDTNAQESSNNSIEKIDSQEKADENVVDNKVGSVKDKIQ